MHGLVTGAYRIPAVVIRNRIVTTNKLPTGLNRGYGGQEQYYTLERLVALVAKRLGMDVVDVIRRNLIEAHEFPYRAAAGSLYDSGDYHAALDEALRLAPYDDFVAERESARAAGRLVGIGIGCIVEPSGSNMGYVSIALPAQKRDAMLSKSGCTESVTVAIDPSGATTVRLGSTPQGQGHQTVAAQIIADELGLHPDAIEVVAEMDINTSPWSIASGSYSSRFAPITAVAIRNAARKVAAKLRTIAAHQLGVAAEDVELTGGFARDIAGGGAVSVKRLAGAAHWHPVSLPYGMEPSLFETASYTLPMLGPPDDDDRVNSSAVYGFVADIALIEVERETPFAPKPVKGEGTLAWPMVTTGTSMAVIANAVADALGVDEIALRLTPLRVWEMIGRGA